MSYTSFVYDISEIEKLTVGTIDVIVALFFDGTQNNRNNTNAKQKYVHLKERNIKKGASIEEEKQAQAYDDYGNKDDDSYENDLSNIARLEAYYPKLESEDCVTDSIYIEGIGTEDYQRDQVHILYGASSNGVAMGAGRTGIRGKVRIGCEKLADKCLKIIKKGKRKKAINCLTIDVFGFSRGAAAARNFIHEVTRQDGIKYDNGIGGVDGQYYWPSSDEIPPHGFLGFFLKQKNVTINRICIRFVGLFDTVLSYDPNGHFSASFNTGARNKAVVEGLHLNAINKARRVVHLVAADEYRENFPLTDIRSMGTVTVEHNLFHNIYRIPCANFHTSVAGSKALQLSFPGAHSDIGGGYVEGNIEYVDEILNGDIEKLKQKKETLWKSGWFKEKELTVHSFKRKLSGRRRLSNKYSYILLHIMCEFGVKFGIPFRQNSLENEYELRLTSTASSDGKLRNITLSEDNILIRTKQRLYKYAFDNYTQPYVFNPFIEDEYKDLDKHYAGSKIPEKRFAEYRQKKQELQEQLDLKRLRNEFLHWSSNFDWIGMDPVTITVDGKTDYGERVILPG
ncbi:DUF2235 domain-containing protein [Danxiaibacter flavus]|uniref:DUF2235 domain-containing protein n=1 Tax=Danxiaibacter flavus TaxID=3049108 RepID=A0ABV3ZCP5_9BACT|nr:DUF2235 domain-containing protein [Chitinophagaceae bacterium DXS]